MSFSCNRCGQSFTTKSNLLKHLRKDIECQPTVTTDSRKEQIDELTKKNYNANTYDCSICCKSFNTWQSRSRHYKTCKEKIKQSNVIQECVTLKQGFSGNHNNVSMINQENNIHIHIRDFGQENISYLPKEFLTSCFAKKDIIRLIENIHCTREHPENHNIRVKSQKRNQIELRENERWMIKDEDEALTECVQNGYRILVRHGFKHKKEIIEDELDDDEAEYHSIRDWLETIHDSNKEQKPLKRKILLLLLSNQALLLGKDED